MERSALLILVVGMTLSSGVPAEAPDASWQQIRSGERIVVYKRDVPDSSFDESLAKTVIDARLSALASLIMDGDGLARWIDTVTESRQLEVVSPSEVYQYTLSDAPWPVKDRDAVVLTRITQDADTLVVTIRSSAKPDRIPERKGVVRVPLVESSWALTPQPDGTVEVAYRVHNDTGGELPAWLVNSLASDQPYKTMENLHGLFEGDNGYRDAVLPHIREPGG